MLILSARGSDKSMSSGSSSGNPPAASTASFSWVKASLGIGKVEAVVEGVVEVEGVVVEEEVAATAGSGLATVGGRKTCLVRFRQKKHGFIYASQISSGSSILLRNSSTAMYLPQNQR